MLWNPKNAERRELVLAVRRSGSQLLCSSLDTLGDPDPTNSNRFLCSLLQGFWFIFPLKSVWSQKAKWIPGYKCWWLSEHALSSLQVRVNQSSPKDVIIYAGDIHFRCLGIIIYQKVTFSPSLHHINHSLAKHKDPASGFSYMSYQLPNINSKSVAMASNIAWFICVQILRFKERVCLEINYILFIKQSAMWKVRFKIISNFLAVNKSLSPANH